MGKKFIDGFKYFWGVDESEPEDKTEDFYQEMKHKNLEGDESMQANSNASERSTNTINTSNKVLNIHSNTQMSVVLFQPKTFEESTDVVDTLKSRRPVVLNISEVDKDLGRKIFDFCSGALYALEGHIQQVSKGIFVLAPPNIDIAGDIVQKTESKLSHWLND